MSLLVGWKTSASSGLASMPAVRLISFPLHSGTRWKRISYLGRALLWQVQDHKRASQTMQAHFKPMFASCLLISHWSKQLTWPSSNARNEKYTVPTGAMKEHGYIIPLKEEVNSTTVAFNKLIATLSSAKFTKSIISAAMRPFLPIVWGCKWSVRFTVKPLGDKL